MRRSRRPNPERILLAVAIVTVAVGLVLVAVNGRDYYLASPRDRIYTYDHAVFGSAAPVGIACGAVALLLFLSNFGYQLRKSLKILSRAGSLRLWLDWHVASGLLAAGYVLLHSGGEMRNWIVKTCVYAFGVVLATGVVGRFLLRFVPRTASGGRADIEAFEDQLLELIDDVRPHLAGDAAAARAMQNLMDQLEDARVDPALPDARRVRRVRSRLRDAHDQVHVIERALAGHKGGWLRARRLRSELARLGRQVAVLGVAGAMMDSWRAFHRAFALLLLCAVATHVGISLYYGYGAFWR